jgi:GNAT superfamily N-acetyltransferase
MENINFVRVENDKHLQDFMTLWLSYFHELGDERNDDKILGHAKKILEYQDHKKQENEIYNIELCLRNNSIIGFCFFCIVEIKFQKDTEYGLIIKPLMNNNDYGYIMEYYILPKYRLKGYGKAMHSHIIETYKRQNIKKVMLTPDTTAISFWEKCQFYNSGKIDPTNNLPIYLKEI